MRLAGVRDFKNKLGRYLEMVKEGDEIVVTNRGKPVAIFHGLDSVREVATPTEKLGVAAKQGKLRLPRNTGPFAKLDPVPVKGKLFSETVIEDRR